MWKRLWPLLVMWAIAAVLVAALSLRNGELSSMAWMGFLLPLAAYCALGLHRASQARSERDGEQKS